MHGPAQNRLQRSSVQVSRSLLLHGPLRQYCWWKRAHLGSLEMLLGLPAIDQRTRESLEKVVCAFSVISLLRSFALHSLRRATSLLRC